MKRSLILLLAICTLFAQVAKPQNTPSLVLNRNINTTFTIIGFDNVTHELGIAVATNNIYVGNSTIYVQPGVGAFAVIAETEPAYAMNGFEQLRKGKTVEQAIRRTLVKDELSDYRQVAGMDAEGNAYAFRGASIRYWKGTSGHLVGKNCVVMGNQLADGVLPAMARTFEGATGTLAERLLNSLLAGEQAGGQTSGKQSAALLVKGTDNEWFNQIDLRVDNSKTPFEDLRTLLGYHYGRILLNRAIVAIKDGRVDAGKEMLVESESMIEGWSGMYGKVAEGYLLLGDEKKAVSIVRKALLETPQWQANLPAFYFLMKKYPELGNLRGDDSFTVEDWNDAIGFLLEIGRPQESIELAVRVLKRFPKSSYTFYLSAKARAERGESAAARADLEIALRLDGTNAEAARLLTTLRHR